MSLYLKRWVSGNKTRFRDDQLDIELDLAYVTDRIIVMGFPAVGVESIYRNHRADVQRFLSARHGSDFWVFNLCPVRENAYDERVFDRRISRYPFPDHHVPPFSYFPLATREMHTWLAGSDARVAVLHCKAGKGRSGTMACAYLLSLDTSSSVSIPTTLGDSFSQWSLIGSKEGLQTPSVDPSVVLPAETNSLSACASGADLSRVSSEPMANTLEKVLDLHTSRRMKSSLHHSRHKKPKMGVSIPSQQRWLSYWSQILVGKGPLSLQPFPESAHPETRTPRLTKVKLAKLTVRMHEPTKIQSRLVRAGGAAITRAGKGRAVNQLTEGTIWASLSRYSDQLVDKLERLEKASRSSPGTTESNLFEGDQWDRAKMIRSFAQMGISHIEPAQENKSVKPISTYILHPLPDWVDLCDPVLEPNPTLASKSFSHTLEALPGEENDPEDTLGIVLEADRELRIKLFMGEITLGWAWLIPAFHMSPGSPSSTLVLSNDDIDFAIGIGKALVDMRISFVWHTCEESL